MEELFPGVFSISGKLATINLAPGKRVYGERLERIGDQEYRFWDPFRSKLSAAIINGLKFMPIEPGKSVLYLGASTGTTPSHVSDILGEEGIVYCVEFAPRVLRELLGVCEVRPNMIPIMGDARQTDEYAKFISGKVDVIYEDVADPSQAEIMNINAKAFLKKGGIGMITIKSQSIDVTKKPEVVFNQVIAELEPHFEVLQKVDINPFDKLHMFLVVRYLG